jgi:hypothetical protein
MMTNWNFLKQKHQNLKMKMRKMMIKFLLELFGIVRAPKDDYVSAQCVGEIIRQEGKLH